MANSIWTSTVALFALWVLGAFIHVGGGLIHFLLVLALMGFAYNLISSRSLA
jgi:Family of unknown function (DUF5670)